MANRFIGSLDAALSILENAVEGILIADIKSRQFKYANTAICDMFGYTSREFLRLSLRDIHPPYHGQAAEELFESQARGDMKTAPSIPCLRKNGTVFWADINTSQVVVSGIACNVGFFTDVSERRLAEEALSHTAQEWQKTFDADLDAIWILDKDQRIIRCNKMARQMFGRTNEEMIGKFCWEVTHGLPQPIAECPAARVTKSLSRESMELPIGPRWCAIHVDPILDAEGRISGFVHIVSDITTRRQAEQLLRESEERFSMAFKTSPYAYMIANLDDGAIIEVNDAVSSISGFTREEILGRTTLTLNFWVNEADRRRMVASLRESGLVTGMETQLRAKNGTIRTVLLFARLIRLGQRACILSIIEDITERKQAEGAHIKSEERYRRLIETTDTGYVIIDERGVVLDANEEYVRLSGHGKLEEILGRSVVEWTAPEEKERNAQAIAACIRKGFIRNLDVTYVDRAGKRTPIGINATMIETGADRQILTLCRDITERKKTEEAMAAEKERLAVTLRSIGDAVIAADMRGRIVLMNQVAETLTGWPLADAAGKPLSDVFHVIDETTRERAGNPGEKVLDSGAVIELATHSLLVARDGQERVISASGAPIKDAREKTIGVVLVFRDITDKQKFLDSMQRTAKLESLGILAGGIAHDFNNLLTGIYGYMDLALAQSRDPRITEYLEVMLGTMKRAKALTLQLLTFSKGGAPIQKLTPLSPFIQETTQFALSGSNLTCRFHLAEDLRSCFIDKDQIAQVIDNIVINAQQAMPDGGAIEIIAVNRSFGENDHPPCAPGDYVQVSIRDSGIGIPKDILPRIFDPFYTTKLKGHGLGLSTCHSIVSRHGGCIEVTSDPGQGSTFHVYLPASADSVATDDAAPPRHKGSGTILVMDDEAIVRGTFRSMLEMLGYSVVCLQSGREAVDWFESEAAGHRPVAMIFDLTIPGGMGGTEAVVEIRKFDTTIPIFVASGYADNSVMKNPAAYGFTASISKPFTISDLSEMLDTYLKA